MTWVAAIVQGILLGGLIALFACGLSLLFGTMKVINLAHGDLAVVAAFVAVELVPLTHLPALLSFVIVVPLFMVLGYVGQRTLLQTSLDRGAFTDVVGDVRAVGRDREPVAGGILRGQPLDRHRTLVSKSIRITGQLQIAYLSIAIFVVAVVVLRRPPVLPVEDGHRTDDSRRRGRPGGGPAGRHRPRHVFAVAASIAFATVALAGLAFGMYSSFSPSSRGELVAVRLRGRRDRGPRARRGGRCSVASSWAWPSPSERRSTRASRSSRATSCSCSSWRSGRRASPGDESRHELREDGRGSGDGQRDRPPG